MPCLSRGFKFSLEPNRWYTFRRGQLHGLTFKPFSGPVLRRGNCVRASSQSWADCTAPMRHRTPIAVPKASFRFSILLLHFESRALQMWLRSIEAKFRNLFTHVKIRAAPRIQPLTGRRLAVWDWETG